MQSRTRDDLLLIKVDPPIAFQGSKRDYVIVAAKHDGSSVLSITEWPLSVVVAVQKSLGLTYPEGGGTAHSSFVETNEVEVVAWAELFQSERDLPTITATETDRFHPDFYLKCRDDKGEEQLKKCWRIEGKSLDHFGEAWLIRVSPSIELSNSQFNEVIVAAKNAEKPVKIITDWPVPVFVLKREIEDHVSKNLGANQPAILCEATLYRTESDANMK